MSEAYTCITCQVLFQNPELQRDHYKSDWHRYNLKRKVASLLPVTLEEFQTRVQEHRKQEEQANVPEIFFCKCCSKSFSSKNAFSNHMNSKKHKLAFENYKEEPSHASDSDSFVKVEAAPKEQKKFVVLKPEVSDDEDIETDSDIEMLDSDEWEECSVEEDHMEEGSEVESEDEVVVIRPRDCLFCVKTKRSRTVAKNFKHMLEEHSFSIPYPQFCTDIMGLLKYLGEKIAEGFMCLYCNKAFDSLEAIRHHMISKCHCVMLYEGVALAEYANFYDYSSFDFWLGPVGEEEDELQGPADYDSVAYELVLPSGARVGHRSLMRYFKQHLPNSGQVVLRTKSNRRLQRLLCSYRAIGMAPKEEESAARKARDIEFMKREKAKWQMKMSVKNNKFQKHYRAQVNF